MKYVRIRAGGQILYGQMEGEKIRVIQGNPFEHAEGFGKGICQLTEVLLSKEETEILAPVVPGKILCIGLNYKDHIKEAGAKTPDKPVVFMKPSTSVIGTGEDIAYPEISEHVEFEGELAVIIGKKGKNIKKSDAFAHIAGYSCANDVSARDYQPADGQWILAKGFDTFMPLGPCITTGIDPGNLAIITRQNGQIKQSSNTKHLLFDVPYLIEYLSKVMTLCPGDVILTGTPSGVAPVKAGDCITIEIENIGNLTNKVR